VSRADASEYPRASFPDGAVLAMIGSCEVRGDASLIPGSPGELMLKSGAKSARASSEVTRADASVSAVVAPVADPGRTKSLIPWSSALVDPGRTKSLIPWSLSLQKRSRGIPERSVECDDSTRSPVSMPLKVVVLKVVDCHSWGRTKSLVPSSSSTAIGPGVRGDASLIPSSPDV
jgi:hypothetical protein